LPSIVRALPPPEISMRKDAPVEDRDEGSLFNQRIDSLRALLKIAQLRGRAA
jgi:hypothetical protein